MSEITGHREGGVVNVSTEPRPKAPEGGSVIRLRKPVSRQEGPLPKPTLIRQQKGRVRGSLSRRANR